MEDPEDIHHQSVLMVWIILRNDLSVKGELICCEPYKIRNFRSKKIFKSILLQIRNRSMHLSHSVDANSEHVIQRMIVNEFYVEFHAWVA